MTEQSPPSALLAVQVAEIVFQRVKKELFGDALEGAFKRGLRVGEFAGPPPTPQASDVAAAFDRGRLLGQTEGRMDNEKLKAQVRTVHEAFLNVCTERDGIRDEHAKCAGDFQSACHDRNVAEKRYAQEAAKARSLHRRLELVRAYLPSTGSRGPQVVDALDERVDPWSILLPNEPF